MLGDLLSEETNPGEVHMDDPSYEARTNILISIIP